MGNQMEYTLVNPNHICSYRITAQENPFANVPIFISIKNQDLLLTLVRKGIFLGVATRTPTDLELQTFPHIILYPDHEWDPHNVHFQKSSHTMEEDISDTVRDVKTKREAFYFEEK